MTAATGGHGPGMEEPVYFDVVDGVIRRVRFSYYVD